MELCCVGEKAEKELRLTVDFLKLIAEENRLKILCLLAQGELCVCKIWSALNIPQNLTSHHLKALKEYGLISSRKEGLNVYYVLNIQVLKDAQDLLEAFLTAHKRVCLIKNKG
ncbi:TPA: transcriptional regulator [Candidatus Dependentiae bacterium]|nr:MAG: Helix-turn-helix transcriptional regulator, ArsR family [candidate division TM6 bacterium GW2011_GWF2_36_131]KKQ03620.1 MAG: Helix-turn-helix transcriptional regulator, ArsR family [candidate division TM6 bacterium GW2011_GWE2_36_25]KKQ18063.1 MAG: Helix-turn-helix transcriptional regulator, ArsR family [candidate division TM6 bacterium GW2011_GWA2_36_9]HBR70647.1 transcriptional regulator [Candidatus Dependentiae bacterium]HCU00267.1 transcriptional regulator [Candidatus Dependentiae b